MFWYDGLWQVPVDLGGSTKNKKRLAKFKNVLAFQLAFSRFVEDALGRYDFEGLPETVSKRVVLQSLLWHANVVFFDYKGSVLALPSAPTGDLNIYGDPATAETFSINGMLNERVDLFIHGSDQNAFLAKTLTIGDSTHRGAMVWENKNRYPFINTVMFYAQAVADTMRTLDVVRANIKNPSIFVAEESVVNTVKKFLSDREDNVDSVISSGVFDPNKVSVIPYDTKGTSLADVTALVEWYESKFRELCGTRNNAQMDKKGENLIQAEVSVNDDYTEDSVQKCIETMSECLDDVNKILGTNITVKAREVQNENVSADDNGRAGGVAGSSDNGSESNDN